MSKVQNPIIGAAIGQAGGMIFTRSLDKNIMRSRPISYADRNSPAQQDNRQRMAICSGLTKADSKKALDSAFPTRPYGQTRYSRFLQLILVVVAVSNKVAAYAWANLVAIGNGTLEGLTGDPAYTNETTGIQINWDSDANGTTRLATDKVYVFLFNQTKGTGYSEVTTATRDDENVSIPYPAGWLRGDTIKCYVGITRPGVYDSSPAIAL